MNVKPYFASVWHSECTSLDKSASGDLVWSLWCAAAGRCFSATCQSRRQWDTETGLTGWRGGRTGGLYRCLVATLPAAASECGGLPVFLEWCAVRGCSLPVARSAVCWMLSGRLSDGMVVVWMSVYLLFVVRGGVGGWGMYLGLSAWRLLSETVCFPCRRHHGS